MKTLSRTAAGPSFRGPLDRIPWLSVADVAGLTASGLLATLVVDEADGAALLIVLVALGGFVWISMRGVGSLRKILTRSDPHDLLAPALTSLAALGWLLLLDVTHSTSAVLLFVAAWTVWLVLARAIRGRYRRWTRIMTLGRIRFHDELRHLPKVTVQVTDAPPDSFDAFDIVAVDPCEVQSDEWSRWLLHADMAGTKIVAAPLVIETLARRLPLEALHDRWAPYLVSGRKSYAFWKRLVDIVVVVMAAVPLLVFCFVVALVVYLDDGGPVLFFQDRMGPDRASFRMAKFRTMSRDAERDGAAFTSPHDPRVTRVGSLLRKYRLDELPQFFHVLHGEMSIVGPRPEQSHFAREYERTLPLYQLRHNVRPGITGWAQVMQGYAANSGEAYEKLRYDCYYVRHYSFALDAQIVMRTIGIVLTGFGSR